MYFVISLVLVVKTGGRYQVTEAGVDTTRTVKVQFIATNNGAMPWEFAPKVHEVTVHPGKPTEVAFYAKIVHRGI